MMFKTYDSDIEGITNKLGFSKRSFAEWGEQVSSAFTESEGKMNKFKNVLRKTSENQILIISTSLSYSNQIIPIIPSTKPHTRPMIIRFFINLKSPAIWCISSYNGSFFCAVILFSIRSFS